MASMRRSMERCSFAMPLLYSAEPVHAPDMVNIKIDRFASIEDLSRFMLQGRIAYDLRTSHVLMVQWDSWVVDSSYWTDEFLEYDYIGAPWGTLAKHRVGNGGFSLRSKRLLQWLANRQLPRSHPEDNVICWELHDEIEAAGMKFAPLSLAHRFSIERVPEYNESFGFHGSFNFWRYLSPEELDEMESQLRPLSASEQANFALCRKRMSQTA